VDILIDTQVLVWLVTDDPRLGKMAKQTLVDTTNTVSISYFSFFEMTIKASVGKLSWDTSLINDLPSMGIELLMPDTESLQGYAILNPSNRDPFDNIIVSVVRSRNAVLMTSDPKILNISSPGFSAIDARE
jgi:PIN domain nuclease of toxin-antitoxin system